MSGRPIGYYVHHHGDGHLARALTIARAAPPGRVVLLGTRLDHRTGDLPFVDLPDDAPAADSVASSRQAGVLHYAPRNHSGVRERTARIAAWIARERPSLVVADVSVEVAMLARLASTATAYVRLNGSRTDAPHMQAFAAADGLLAPFAAGLDDEDTPADIRRRTFYVPGLTARPLPATRTIGVLGVVGRGGPGVGIGLGDGEQWAAAARAVPDMTWTVVGPCTLPRKPPPNLKMPGWVDDVAARIAGAEVVVGAAGDGLVGAVIAARRPFVCLPEPRPYGEQIGKAARLQALGAAIVRPTWPMPERWPEIIVEARYLDTAVLATLDAVDGPENAAAWLTALADRCGADG